MNLQDLIINERSGYVVFRFGKGGKQRQAPLPRESRKAIQQYLQVRPPADSEIDQTSDLQKLSDRIAGQTPEGWELFDKVKVFMAENLYEHINDFHHHRISLIG